VAFFALAIEARGAAASAFALQQNATTGTVPYAALKNNRPRGRSHVSALQITMFSDVLREIHFHPGLGPLADKPGIGLRRSRRKAIRVIAAVSRSSKAGSSWATTTICQCAPSVGA
jgi:hypothetical protein